MGKDDGVMSQLVRRQAVSRSADKLRVQLLTTVVQPVLKAAGEMEGADRQHNFDTFVGCRVATLNTIRVL